MKLDEARQKTRELVDEYFEVRNLDPKDRLTTLAVTPKSKEHLGVGYARVDDDRYGIEVRLRREGGKAAKFADKLRHRYGDSISVSTVERVQIPSQVRAQDSGEGTASDFAKFVRPLSIGLSVAHRDALAGSAGLFVEFEDGEYRGRHGVISNSHVLALSGRAKQGDPIFQPGRPDAKPLANSHRVGTLVDFTILSPNGAQELDAAVAVLDADLDRKIANLIPKDVRGCADCGKPISGVVEPESLGPRATVCKVGRTTAWTRGSVTAVGVDNLPVFSPHLRRNLRFDNVFEITWTSLEEVFSGPGDSGSLVYDPVTMCAIGLVFAGGIREVDGKRLGVSYACNLSSILRAFKLRMISER
ncbi:hypothetical protein [Methylobacterium sp. Leaf465]|uniref:hypothetical protein n=1 Tax=Methylobacterium sp. Leaf465 TaxID=1736385 RepID=UPI000A9FAE62|nr:hypothetical protein [Methylobacterium sp. Leaf465]